MAVSTYNFDQVLDRRGTDCAKYDIFDDTDVLPLWVADMDFQSPPEIGEALKERIDHGFFGYTMPSNELREVLVQRMADLYDWAIKPEEIVFIPGVVSAFNNAIRATGEPGDNFLVNTPVYPPFLSATGGNGQSVKVADLRLVEDGQRLHYEIDFDAFEAAIDERTKLFLMCSPHNPVGRVWTEDELTRIAEICEKHDMIICSDEIHCDLLMPGVKHVPTAAISPEISKRTITLMAPSKTFNIPSLGFSFAIIQDEDLRHKFEQAERGVVPHVGVMGYTAGLAAYKYGDDWLKQVMQYIKDNRDYMVSFIEQHMPQVKTTVPEGTYLAWLDCRAFNDAETTAEGFGAWIEPYFLEHAKVALNNGQLFGESGKGFARLNFACPRETLEAALNRMKDAL